MPYTPPHPRPYRPSSHYDLLNEVERIMTPNFLDRIFKEEVVGRPSITRIKIYQVIEALEFAHVRIRDLERKLQEKKTP